MTQVGIYIEKPIDAVFSYISDVGQFIQDSHVSEPRKFSAFGIFTSSATAQIESVQQTSANPLGVGTTFVQKNILRGRRSEITVQIIEYNPPYQMTYIINGDTVPTSKLRFLLTTEGSGTYITEIFTIENFGVLQLLFRSNIKEQIKTQLQKVKDKLERSS